MNFLGEVFWLRRVHRSVAGLLLALLLLSIALPGSLAVGENRTVTVLFTHDLHAHFLPQTAEDGAESGGFARLAAALAAERASYPQALTLDAGDFSMGSLIQALYATQAPELVTMGAMGYDATTAGNHEFDYGALGFANMLNAAKNSGAPLPALLMANYVVDKENPNRETVLRAMSRYGVSETMLLERGNVTYGIFGVMGVNSAEDAPASGFVLEDAAAASQRCVDALKEQGAEFIIALSHSGTNANPRKSEDEQLARTVSGIDLIISGHTHTTLSQPVVVGDTYIVSAGAYCENLGSATFVLGEGEKALIDYRLIPIDGTLREDAGIAQLVDTWKKRVSSGYLSEYGYTYDQVLAYAPFDLTAPEHGVQAANSLGELVSDAYRYAVEQAEGEDYVPVAAAITAEGLLRASLREGEITISQAFDVLPLGIGEDGRAGYPLVSVWLTGKELKVVLEIDASIAPGMPEAQLYLSGVEYQTNTLRIFFNRVTKSALILPDGGIGKLEDEKLYRVVTGLYSIQMLAAVESRSLGLFNLQPKDAQGNPVTDFTQHIVRDRYGGEVKEWYALASYLESFRETDGVASVAAQYAQPDGRKEIVSSLNPVLMLKNANWLTLAAVVVLLIFGGLFIFAVRKSARYLRRRRYGGSFWGRRR